ncbi:transglutaminase-like domain-containing protein [Thalassoroseus pseudoceratinae]|uniref:transglutaminase-like domain-containing protein n=1 Tax=Thalassoroseus pseudoceratinae TaxID=2713176 RepID=UPI00141EF2E5|nr:transglutaminase-like domain-containing protein [Thalassoroseus pseudoceratinae]
MIKSQAKTTGNNSEATPGWAVVALILLATLAAEVVIGDGAVSRGVIMAKIAFYGGLVVVGRRVAMRWRRRSPDVPLLVGPVVVVSALLAIGVEFLSRQIWGTGHAFEVLLICGFRNVALVLAAFSVWPRVERLGGAASLFLILFVVMAGDDPFLYFVLFAFTLIGCWWLMSRYWNSLAGRIADETHADRPLRWFITLPICLVAAVLLVPLSGRTATEALPGLMPSSGGTGDFSPYARSGVGDGDMLVAGTKDVQSFAPIDNAPFMDSKKPSLFDVYNETYDEPVKPKNQDRCIALPPEVMQDVHRHLAESKQAGREFSTLRQTDGQRKSKIDNRDTDALFFVAGRTPLHLRLDVYATFDGIQWYPDQTPGPSTPLTMRNIDERPWLDLTATKRSRDDEVDQLFASPETHALKVAQLETNRIPSPTELLGVHIDSVDRADLFGWATEGVPMMERKSLPSMTVIHLLSRAFDQSALKTASIPAYGAKRHRQIPDSFHFQQIGRLAKRWTDGMPHGWPKVQAIVERLRTDFQHDRTVKVSDETISPVSQFLMTRRGPDYQFATAATMMIRSLGFPARVVSGFYVRPDKYDSRSRHTPVHAEDAHFWVEVYHSDGVWVPLEPTPGYELLGPPLGLWDMVQITVVGVGKWVADHRWAVLAVAFIGCVLWMFRRRVADFCDLAWWRLRPHRSPQSELLTTWGLMERRWRRHGYIRPCGLTPTRWLDQRNFDHLGSETLSDATAQFLKSLDAVTFGSLIDFRTQEMHRLCEKVLDEWLPVIGTSDASKHTRQTIDRTRIEVAFGSPSLPT